MNGRATGSRYSPEVSYHRLGLLQDETQSVRNHDGHIRRVLMTTFRSDSQ